MGATTMKEENKKSHLFEGSLMPLSLGVWWPLTAIQPSNTQWKISEKLVPIKNSFKFIVNLDRQ